jgi:nitroreductase
VGALYSFLAQTDIQEGPSMNTLEAIAKRRSIRRFKSTPVPRALLEQVLAATLQAPSAKNRQPWRLVVLEGAAKDKLAELMLQGAAFLKAQGEDVGSCEGSARVVAQAPVTIVVFNAAYEHEGLIFEHSTYNAPDIQSIGGAIQTMLLAAEELGLGSLWIADVLYAYPLIREWLGHKDELVAAVTLGYADEAPNARPRKSVAEVTTWRAEA